MKDSVALHIFDEVTYTFCQNEITTRILAFNSDLTEWASEKSILLRFNSLWSITSINGQKINHATQDIVISKDGIWLKKINNKYSLRETFYISIFSNIINHTITMEDYDVEHLYTRGTILSHKYNDNINFEVGDWVYITRFDIKRFSPILRRSGYKAELHQIQKVETKWLPKPFFACNKKRLSTLYYINDKDCVIGDITKIKKANIKTKRLRRYKNKSYSNNRI